MTRALFWLALSDLLDRTRRKGFVVAALSMVVLATLYLPSQDASYVTATVGKDVRGLYDSAWIGAVTACLSSLLFPLAAFFLVRGSVAREEETRFGEILAATPVSKVEYVLGKTFSNFCYLAALTGLIALSGAAIQLVRAEDFAVNPVELLLPTVVIVWPTMLLVSAIAVLFECVPLLRGGLGSVAYFALYLYAVAGLTLGDSVYQPTPDPLGVRLALEEMSHAAAGTAGLGPAPEPNVGVNPSPQDLATFGFAGLSLGTEALLGRLAWASTSLVAVLAAALAFSRFDPAREAGPIIGLLPVALRRRPRTPSGPGAEPGASPDEDGAGALSDGAPASLPVGDAASLSPLGDARGGGRFRGLVAAELRLALKGRSPWWYGGMVALVGLGALLPLENARLRFAARPPVAPDALVLARRPREAPPDGGDLPLRARRPHGRNARRLLGRRGGRAPRLGRRGREDGSCGGARRSPRPRRRRPVRARPGPRLRRGERREYPLRGPLPAAVVRGPLEQGNGPRLRLHLRRSRPRVPLRGPRRGAPRRGPRPAA